MSTNYNVQLKDPENPDNFWFPITLKGNVTDLTDFVGATSSAAGANGLVPAPSAGDQTKFLRGDGSWQDAGGGGGSYTLPHATSSALGGIKIGYTETGSNYAVALDGNDKAYVNVPWTDTEYKTSLNGTNYPSSPASGATSLGSWYAPTVAGSQYNLLVSNGSGAPSWFAQGSNTGLLKFTNGSGWSIDTNSYVTSNSASLQVSDVANKRINTSETTNKYLQFTGGTNKFTVSDTTGGTGHSFDVAITPSVNWPSGISGLPANNTGCLYNNGTGTWSIHYMTYRGISVNGTNILADSQGQYLNLVAGSNITLTPEQSGNQYTGKITIAASGGGSYTLPTATEGTLGGLIVSSDTDADTGYRNLYSAVAVPVFYGTVSNMYTRGKDAEDYDMENPEQDVTTHYINVRDVVNGIIHDQEIAKQLKPFLAWLLQHNPEEEWPWWDPKE